MPVQDRVSDLVEQALDDDLTPEEACAHDPDLLGEVRACLDRCRRARLMLEEAFSPLAPAAGEPKAGTRESRLPDIPGYEVFGVLGRGGMGVVYQGTQRNLDRPVAIKMLLSDRYATLVQRDLLAREALAIAALHHPNIVQVYDVGEVDGFPYFTMEYVDGGTLADRLESGPMPIPEVSQMIAILAAAVEAAHQRGIVHRDLKPANVLLTRDGLPKVSDFGLAQRAETSPRLSVMQTGARVGTPNYMSPEQALGKRDGIGPTSDVYALGAVLYEMLTGRPPFLAESFAETERLLLSQDPMPPSRLNGRVSRDMENICLKCLEKKPDRRYSSAAALGDDLARYRRNEPITARRANRLERAVKWSRRRPAAATALVGGTVIFAMITGAAMWFGADRAATARSVREDLRAAVGLQQTMSWREANAVLDRATDRLGNHGPAELRAELARVRGDADLAARLEAIRMNKSSSSGGVVNLFDKTIEDYTIAFRDAGIGQVGDDPAIVAARIDASNIRTSLIAALDEWARAPVSGDVSAWIGRVIALADHDPSGWRQRARDQTTYKDPQAISALLSDPDVQQQPVSVLLRVADKLNSNGQDPIPLLLKAQRAHPDEFWTNYRLGWFLQQRKRLPESFRYFQAAIALRPDIAAARVTLAHALADANRLDDALLEFQEARRLDPRLVAAWTNAGAMFMNAHLYDEAERELRQGLQLCPNSAALHSMLARVLVNQRRLTDACDQYRAVIALEPNSTDALRGLQTSLIQLGERDGIHAIWEKLIGVNPKDYAAWDGTAEYWCFIGDIPEYERARRLLLDRFADATDTRTCELMGRACLLTPCSDDDLKRITSMLDRAIAHEQVKRTYLYPYILAAKTLAEYRAGHFQASIELVSDEVRVVSPTLSGLVSAMAHARLGHEIEARANLARAVASSQWTESAAIERNDTMIFQVLRHEAEPLIVPNLHAFLLGKYQPTDNNERIAMTAECAFTKRYAAAARSWIEALTAEPSRQSECFDGALVLLMLAGHGIGSDADRASETDRARWRNQALVWLRQIIALSKPPNAEGVRTNALLILTHWYNSADLTPLREGKYAEQLSKFEQDTWAAAWREIAELVNGTRQ